MVRFTRRECDFLVLEKDRRWSDALRRAAIGLEEPSRGALPPERSRERLRRAESLNELEELLVQARASVVAVECAAFPDADLAEFLGRPPLRGAGAVWIRLGTDGVRPTDYLLDWTWIDTAASIAGCERLWRVRRRALERLAPEASGPLSEILHALPWKSSSSDPEQRNESLS